ncbi:GlcNAc-domain-containing protein [Pelagophyceae sp. CCMP2097]|nr:GlcNAc-domain-containing protein [Pelagophyceae sp. CCMP2097]
MRKAAPKRRQSLVRWVVVCVVVAWGLLLLSVVQYSPTSARNSPTSSRITTPSATSARFNTPAAAPTDDPADAAPAAREAAAAIGALPAIHAPAALDALSAEASAAPADGAPAPENTHADHLDAKHGEAIEDPGAEAALAPSGLEMERDDQTGLMVPVFWQPNDDAMQLDAGEPTIFLMIASYRDFQCRDTIASALTRAKFPGRVRVSAVQQNRPEDEGCAEPHVPCEEDPTQVLCTRASQVKVYEMDANEATGPVYARHVGNRMYRGEAFALQIDAHCVFVNGWDTQLIQQWKATKNDMAVLSTYLTDVEGSVSVGGDSLRNTRPIMCNSDYEGSGTARYVPGTRGWVPGMRGWKTIESSLLRNTLESYLETVRRRPRRLPLRAPPWLPAVPRQGPRTGDAPHGLEDGPGDGLSTVPEAALEAAQEAVRRRSLCSLRRSRTRSLCGLSMVCQSSWRLLWRRVWRRFRRRSLRSLRRSQRRPPLRPGDSSEAAPLRSVDGPGDGLLSTGHRRSFDCPGSGLGDGPKCGPRDGCKGGRPCHPDVAPDSKRVCVGVRFAVPRAGERRRPLQRSRRKPSAAVERFRDEPGDGPQAQKRPERRHQKRSERQHRRLQRRRARRRARRRSRRRSQRWFVSSP